MLRHERGTCALITGTDAIVSLEYILSVSRGSLASPCDFGAVAVVDGQDLKFTPFRNANVPPPMALYEIGTLSNVIDVAFNADCTSMAVLHQKGIALYDLNLSTQTSSAPSLTARVTFDNRSDANNLYQQICFNSTDEVTVLSSKEAETGILARYGFDADSGRMEVKDSDEFRHSSISCLAVSSGADGSLHAFAKDSGGDIHCQPRESKSLFDCPDYPTVSSQVELVRNHEDLIVFSLSGNGNLYANSRLLVKNCTSFLVTPAHLVFTTTTHLLKFVHITSAEGW